MFNRSITSKLLLYIQHHSHKEEVTCIPLENIKRQVPEKCTSTPTRGTPLSLGVTSFPGYCSPGSLGRGERWDWALGLQL